ncbi:RING-H2 finger protein ATL70-like isoform X1 [Herrania umbratica]|uniref:RING-type E3 ubiquitin transferase n=2 Tax=Herrania umbratica TaxID=108875 RepID=A0A6J1BEC2_9ROSI|nr:RING-H2 finger protein ATL70-like isoform X1 [Herrania umbratica]
MNSTEDSNDSPQMGKFAYAIGFSTAIIALLFMIALSAYFCNRANQSTNPSSPHGTTSTDQDSVAREQGLDEETLSSYPELLYSQAKLHKPDSVSSTSSCSICLGEYKDTDMLRLLPACGHVFHLKCVDSWLRLHPTCPICRNSPAPTPLATPLAEVTPLAIC